ncbi:MAG: septum site-determining protein MinC [Alphaproteobacteria bacterium]
MAEAMAESARSQPVDFANHGEFFQIRGQLYALVTLRVVEPDNHQFFMELHKEIGRAPDFYKHAPVVIDVGPIADRNPTNLAEFARRLRQLQLVPVGIQNGSEDWNRVAINAGLSLFPAGRPASGQKAPPASDRPAADAKHPAEPPAAANRPAAPQPESRAAAPRAGAKIVSDPVRAGQQIYAKDADLVVLAQVQPGAELMADGNIHIYGNLRGRAHAGVGGDTAARIFCRSMEAQLISIAGIYLVNDEIEPQFLGQPVQIGCQNETIVIEKLT